MSDAEQNRSEQATPFKLAKAREKGTVARGADLGFLTALAAFCGYGWIAGAGLEARITDGARQALAGAPQILASPNEILAVTGLVLSAMVRPVAFMAAVIFVVVLVFEILQTGPVFSALKLDFSRLNPATGLKRVVSVRLLIETAKNIFKLGLYVGLAYVVMRQARAQAFASITDARGLAEGLSHFGFRLLVLFLAAALLFAALDQLIVRRDFQKKMRMSRREVRRERRDREGEPRMKQRRKQLHAQFSKLSQSLRNVRGADLLITNPTHFAVALRYDPRTMTAPQVVSRGAHQFAQRLKSLAFVYGVVIVQNPPLARALYRACEIDRDIPEAFYKPVADLYLDLKKRKAESSGAQGREAGAHA
ncbi:MAG: EscU/YscU/HrcU family type III secretion system export apparatus switch protein [Caulobacteraceae bacterium]|nr:EscU/YscU/HrcU family type III secretion system export apparatus switch protein [Caulobacteraceae bacterium]